MGGFGGKRLDLGRFGRSVGLFWRFVSLFREEAALQN